jgi:hypothetical protein
MWEVPGSDFVRRLAVLRFSWFSRLLQMSGCSPLKIVLHPLPFDFITHGLLYRSPVYKHSA